MKPQVLLLGLCACLFFCAADGFAQKKKNKKGEEKEELDERISTRLPAQDSKVSSKSVARTSVQKQKSTKGKTSVKPIRAENKFVETRTWKRQVAYEEAREDPSFGDAMYFGHKKKPKKNPPGKRKLCKECGMVH